MCVYTSYQIYYMHTSLSLSLSLTAYARPILEVSIWKFGRLTRTDSFFCGEFPQDKGKHIVLIVPIYTYIYIYIYI